ncbi:MAG: carboxyltransferase domain-containing protein [Pseudomonadota bacterium]
MESFPHIRLMGVTGVLVRFSDRLSEPANRAALAFRAAAEAEAWPGVAETSTALASAFLRIDVQVADPRDVAERAAALVRARDWLSEPLPTGRKLWRIPCAWGGQLAPDLADAAAHAGLDETAAIEMLSAARVRVLTLGFAPGQPYLGELDAIWDLSRRTELAPRVPAGALLLAIRQLVLFTAPGPTGWRHVGQSAFKTFRPDDPAQAAPLRPGDELCFPAVREDDMAALLQSGDPDGGATAEPMP